VEEKGGRYYVLYHKGNEEYLQYSVAGEGMSFATTPCIFHTLNDDIIRTDIVFFDDASLDKLGALFKDSTVDTTLFVTLNKVKDFVGNELDAYMFVPVDVVGIGGGLRGKLSFCDSFSLTGLI
jgi:hypothetical protein